MMSVTAGGFRLSPEFFQKTRLVNRCLTECATECCSEGVWLTLHDARRIVAHSDQIQSYLVEPVDLSQWDLSKPAYIATPVLHEGTREERCCFFTLGRRCGLHSFALDNKFPVKDIKPFSCILFPLTLVDIDFNLTEIAIDTKAYKTCLVESDQPTWLYRQFEPDLRRVISDEGYLELLRMFPD